MAPKSYTLFQVHHAFSKVVLQRSIRIWAVISHAKDNYFPWTLWYGKCSRSFTSVQATTFFESNNKHASKCFVSADFLVLVFVYHYIVACQAHPVIVKL